MAQLIQSADLTRNTPLTRNESDWIYNGLDCCVTFEVLEALESQLDETAGATYGFSRNLQGPVLEMTLRGIRIDQVARSQTLDQVRRDIRQLGSQLDVLFRDGYGIDVKWSSPHQLKNFFYNFLGITPIRSRGANGKMTPTVNRDALERIGRFHFIAEPVCVHLLALRDLDKKRQFLEGGIDPDGRFRSSYNIAGTNTGRLSSSITEFGTGSNAQNIDRKLRRIFVADPGYKMANVDLEQADARNVGAICWNIFVEEHGEAFAGAYLDACESGDLHTTVCRMAWTNLDWPEDRAGWRAVADQIAYRDMTYRDLAKRLGHGTNYFGTPRTMAMHTKVDQPLIEDFQYQYFVNAFPAIGSTNKKDLRAVNWHNWTREQLRTKAHLITPFGRRRFFWGRWSEDETLRAAIAYSPQSMTADEIDIGLLRVFRDERPVMLLAQVHDSILFQYPEHLEDEILPWLIEALRVELSLARDRPFSVPTEAKVGWNWGDAYESNPDGMLKWKGGDERKRQVPVRDKLSIRDY